MLKMKGQSMIIKLIKWKRFGGRRANKTISSSNKNSSSDKGSSAQLTEMGSGEVGDIKWEVRPGGMLVQKRDHIIISSSSSSSSSNSQESTITSTIRISIIQVSTASHWHDVSIDETSTFGELKVILSLMTGLEPREQRLLYRGKEREDDDHLHMVGVSVGDKVLLLEDPALKDTRTQLLRLNVDNRLSPPHESHFGRSTTTISVCSSNKEDKENLRRPMGWEFRL